MKTLEYGSTSEYESVELMMGSSIPLKLCINCVIFSSMCTLLMFIVCVLRPYVININAKV